MSTAVSGGKFGKRLMVHWGAEAASVLGCMTLATAQRTTSRDTPRLAIKDTLQRIWSESEGCWTPWLSSTMRGDRFGQWQCKDGWEQMVRQKWDCVSGVGQFWRQYGDYGRGR